MSSSSSPPSYRSRSSRHRSGSSHEKSIKDTRDFKESREPKEPRHSKPSSQKSVDPSPPSNSSPKQPLLDHNHKRESSQPVDHVVSHYSPEFLKDFAEKRLSTATNMLLDGSKYKFITGDQAASMYEDYIKNNGPSAGTGDHPKRTMSKLAPPVVFAFTVNDAGRKVVDYYMTWRGKTKAHRLRGLKRRVNFLDHEFNKLSETINKEFNRMSQAMQPSTKPPNAILPVAGTKGSHVERKPSSKKRSTSSRERSTSPKEQPTSLKERSESQTSHVPESSSHKRDRGDRDRHRDRDCGKSNSKPDDTKRQDSPPQPPRPPLGAPRASVISIPFLSTPVGGAESNRNKLVVTNPDASSPTASEYKASVLRNQIPANIPLEASTSVETLVGSETGAETTETTTNTTPEVTPDRRHSKFSMHSILSKSRRSKSKKDNESVKSGKKHPSDDHPEPASDTEMPEIVVALLDEMPSSSPWFRMRNHFPSRKPSGLPPNKSSPWLPKKQSSDDEDDYDSSSSCSSCSSSSSSDDDYEEGGWENAPVVPLSLHLQQAQLARSQVARSQSTYPSWPVAQSAVIPSAMPQPSAVHHYLTYAQSPANMSAPAVYHIPSAPPSTMSPMIHLTSPAMSMASLAASQHMGPTPMLGSVSMMSPTSYHHHHIQPFRPGSQRELDEFARNSPYLSPNPGVLVIDVRSPALANTPLSGGSAVWAQSPRASVVNVGYHSPAYPYPSTPGRSATY